MSVELFGAFEDYEIDKIAKLLRFYQTSQNLYL